MALVADTTKTSSAGEAASVATGRRILVYGMNYAPEIAGVGKYTGEIAEHLASEGMDVTVVTTPPHYPGWKVQPGHRNRFCCERLNDVRIFRAPLFLRRNMKGIWRLLAPLSFALSSAPVVVWQILRRRPETVFCVEPTLFAAPLALFAARLVGARTVLHVQDLEVDAAFAVGHLGSRAWLKKLGLAFERLTLARFNHVVTISNRMAEKLGEKSVRPERISVVRNWVDLSHIYPMEDESPYRAELGFTKDDFVVLYSGNIGAKQGLNILLESAKILGLERHIIFVIAGDGPNKNGLMQKCENLNNVKFLPFQPKSRLNEFLNMADLHILPQESGSADLVLPSKLGGMLASGRPILVTASEGTELAEFLESTVMMVAPDNAEVLAEAILRASRKGDAGGTAKRLAKCRVLDHSEGLKKLIRVLE